MKRPDYTPAELAARHKQYANICVAVSMCQLPEVRQLWESAVINGLDTCDDLLQLRREWNMPELTGLDVEAIISITSACGLTPERSYSARTRTWFRNRGIIG